MLSEFFQALGSMMSAPAANTNGVECTSSTYLVLMYDGPKKVTVFHWKHEIPVLPVFRSPDVIPLA